MKNPAPGHAPGAGFFLLEDAMAEPVILALLLMQS
jgi:hypothetical protein